MELQLLRRLWLLLPQPLRLLPKSKGRQHDLAIEPDSCARDTQGAAAYADRSATADSPTHGKPTADPSPGSADVRRTQIR